ncbi:ketoacyl-synt-domain-containing protein [Fomes fomentarius]|nr:ketoacyl-synt-domain-containing protein [Fomes fomentarius]
MAVELPGANNTEALWKLLADGLNTVTKIPAERFEVSPYTECADGSSHPGRRMSTTHGSFCEDTDVFDHTFFRISPREARSMDPQQRLLLRNAYKALESAGYVPNATPSFNPDTFSVYVGAATDDYVQNLRNDIDVYYSTGTLQAFLSGKISYAFGFGGPSMVLDTACSASFVALHQACRALLNRDCNAALAGGVNAITSPDMYLGLSRGHFLSPTGQCRPWDVAADGYSRAEGCALFVLKRLQDALAENDHILGTIRAIELNQSAHARSITHPHVPSQVALFEKLLTAAGASPREVNVVECHGTGTQAGDPAELEAVRQVFGRRGPSNRSSEEEEEEENPLYITSIKANIGHAEAASGAASLAKVVLMMREKTIPRHPSFRRLNPRIAELSGDGVRINTVAVPWTLPSTPTSGDSHGSGRKRLALLNNFGASGSNAALLLEEHLDPPRIGPTGSGPGTVTYFVVGMSCRSIAALEERRNAYIKHLERSASLSDNATDSSSLDVSSCFLQDFSYSATARQQLHKYRVAAHGFTQAELLDGLRSAKITEVSPAADVVFVFSGQGGQYAGMGAELYRTCAVVRRCVDECHRRLGEMGFVGVADVFRRPDDAATASSSAPPGNGEYVDVDVDRFQEAHAALFVLEYALAMLWTAWGVKPCAVVSHSFGEFAALVFAGVLTLDDGLRLVATRARLIASKCVPGRTAMSAIRASADCVKPLLAKFPQLEVCCYNSSAHCTVGGAIKRLGEFETLRAREGIQCTRLDIPYAYHSEAMDPVLDGLREAGRHIALSPPTLPVLSNVTGTLVQPGDSTTFTPDYFARHCRESARFQQGISDLQSRIDVSTVAVCIELGPHPTTLSLLRGLQVNGAPLLLPSLRQKAQDFGILCGTLAQLYCTSVPILWRKVFADLTPDARLIDLPPYPFAKTRFWVPFEEEAPRAIEHSSASHNGCDIPSISAPSRSEPGITIEKDIALFSDLIEGHCVAGVALCPASVYTELALSAATDVLKNRSEWQAGDIVELAECLYPKPLTYAPGMKAVLRIEIVPSGRHAGAFSIFSLDDGSSRTQLHCTGSYKKKTEEACLSKLQYVSAMLEREIETVLSASTESFSTRTCYELLFPRVVTYSKAYHAIRTIKIHTTLSTAYAVIQVPNIKSHSTTIKSSVLDPIFVDTLLHVTGFFLNFMFGMNGHHACICSQVDKIKLLPGLIDTSARYGVYTSIVRAKDDLFVADGYAIEVDDPRKRVVACLKRVRFRRVAMASLTRLLRASLPVSATRATPSPPAFAANRPNIKASVPSIDVAQVYLQDIVIDIIAETSGAARNEVVLDADLSHLGVDSLMIWEIVARLRTLVPSAAVDTHTLAAASTVADLVQIVAEKGERIPRSETISSTATVYDADTDESGQILVSRCVSTAAGIIRVKDILSMVLDVPVEDVTDDVELASLGLDSLTSIEARHAFQTQLGATLDGEVMLACRTVRDVVAAAQAASCESSVEPSLAPTRPSSPSPLSATQPHTRPELVRLQTAPRGVDTPPLVLIHDGSGLVSGYVKLAPLGCDVWAIQNSSYATNRVLVDAPSGRELVTMAMSYVGLLTSNLFWNGEAYHGECLLGGWSFGGVLAFDIARRLSLLGVGVKGLVLIDAPAPQTDSPLQDSLIDAVAKGATSQRIVEVIQRQMRYATRALVAYDLSQTPPALGSVPRALYLRSQDRVKIASADAFLMREGGETTIARWEEALGRALTVLDIPGDHFAVFNEENVSWSNLNNNEPELMKLLQLDRVSEQLRNAIAYVQE